MRPIVDEPSLNVAAVVGTVGLIVLGVFGLAWFARRRPEHREPLLLDARAARRTPDARRSAIVWLVILIVAGIGASRLEQQLKVGGFSLPGTEFHTASEHPRRRPPDLVGPLGGRRLHARRRCS